MLLVKATRSRSTSTYVLAGIVINAISKAIIMALKYFADPENELAAMEYWEMGAFGNTTLSKLLSILPMFLIGLIGILLLRRQIELMSLSDNECRALGVRLKPVRAADAGVINPYGRLHNKRYRTYIFCRAYRAAYSAPYAAPQ